MDINITKDKIQQEALKSHNDFNDFSTLEMATRSGKSRVAILRCEQIIKQNPNAKIFLSVPTTKLRDSNWKEEFIKWNAIDIWNNNVTKSCYVSMQKDKDQIFDLVLLDEIHHLTEANIEFFENNEIKSILGLTATIPKDGFKKDIINALCPVSFTYTLDQGKKDKIITDFEIHVLFTELDKVTKNIKSGNAKQRFYVTEEQKYNYLQDKFEITKDNYFNLKKQINDWEYSNYFRLERGDPTYDIELKEHNKKLFPLHKKYESIIFERVRFFQNLNSKTQIGRQLIDKLHKDDLRYIVFCGSIDQANILCGENVFHGEVNDKAFDDFYKGILNYIGCVNKLNEGITVDTVKPVDFAIAVQINGQELNLIQRIGRIICLRENHIAKFYIIVCKNTKDQDWLEKAIQSFSEDVIFYHDAIEYLNEI